MKWNFGFHQWKRNKARMAFVLTTAILVSSILGTSSIHVAIANESEQIELPDSSQLPLQSPSAEASTALAASITPTQSEVQTGNLRLIFTSDIHGKVTTDNFNNTDNRTEGGLSRQVTAIEQTRQEVGKSNTMLFDLGDVLYDYTTDYIFTQAYDEIQPAFLMMAKMGYDAITVGNHEFDYDLTYLKNQYKGAGLTSKVVLSNVWDVNSGKHIWAENKIIKKTIQDANGDEMSVNVGIIGEVVPTISAKRTNYKGVLQTQSIVENVKVQVKKLKAAGADIIVVLNHSGIGTNEASGTEDDTGYEISKIKGVNAILCGHRHRDFPSRSASIYDDVSGLDKENGTANGIPIAQVEHSGVSLGVIDLEVTKTEDTVTTTGTGSVRKINETVEPDEQTNNCLSKWTKEFLEDCTQVLTDIDPETQLQNYFGTQEDTDAIQLINNINISLALQYVKTIETSFKNYPIVSAAHYIRYGADQEDYIDISGDIKKSDLYNLLSYKSNYYLYKITGAQLRELLEWSVGAYETDGDNVVTNEFSTDLSTKKMQYALKSNRQKSWSNLFIFDGIEYQIDTSVPARYSDDGEKINDTRRITKFTRNGETIGDKEIFVLAISKLPTYNKLITSMNLPRIYAAGTRKYQDFANEYISKISSTGRMRSMKDDNWSIKDSGKYNRVLVSGKGVLDYIEDKSWILGHIKEINGYDYYLADMSKKSTIDTLGPCLNTVLKNDSPNMDKETILVSATDSSGIESISYLEGKYSATSQMWNNAKKISGSSFTVKKNGIYSISALDGAGNRRVVYMNITNINQSVLDTPTVDTYSNRKTYITGKAVAKSKIYFKIENGKTYSSTVNSSGKFKYKLPTQKAGTKIYVYLVDQNGKTSASTVVTTKRTGPNKPKMSAIDSQDDTITGTLEDEYCYPMLLVDDKTVYVQNNTVKELYKKSDFYKKKYKVVTGKIRVTGNGKFYCTNQVNWPANSKIKLKTIDALSRVSMTTSKKVTCIKPKKPEKSYISSVTNLSRTVYVHSKEKCSKAIAKIGNTLYYSSARAYNSTTKRYMFTIKIPRTDSDITVRLAFQNAKGQSSYTSIHPVEKVPNLPKVDTLKAGMKKITGQVHLVGSTELVQTVDNTKTTVYVKVGKAKQKKAKITKTGAFRFTCKKPLKKGQKIKIYAQNLNGKSLVFTKRIK